MPPPSSCEMANVVVDGMNTIVMPEMMPETDSGSTTRRNVSAPFAPRSCAASI